MIPKDLARTFRSLATLKVLNVVAVGASLAAATGTAFRGMFPDDAALTFVMLSTLAHGIAWASALRARATIGRSRLRLGWLLSLPLAMSNAAIACGLLFLFDHTTNSWGAVLVQRARQRW